MPAHFDVSPQTAAEYMRLFVNRLCYSRQMKEGDSYPYKRQKKPLDLTTVRQHMNGHITISLYATNPDAQTSKWVAIDADFGQALDSLFALRWELKQDGIEAALEQSRRGGHLWIFNEVPMPSAKCRVYIYNLALRLGVPIKGRGLKEGIEVFPRQDQIESGEFGNAIRGPLGVHAKTNRRYWFYDADANPEAQLAYLARIRKLASAELEILTQGMTMPEAYRLERPAVFVPYVPTLGRTEFRILDFVQPTGRLDSRNWKAPCPSCTKAGKDRSRNNLSIKMSDPRFYQCWAGCSKEDIREALGQPIRKTIGR
jgi:hypothetical protein